MGREKYQVESCASHRGNEVDYDLKFRKGIRYGN